MSALKHGYFLMGFMLCDRCARNGYCDSFGAGKTCEMEEEAFHRLVDDLTKEYELDEVADLLLAERAAMTLIKIARLEAYEAAVGVSEETLLVDQYVTMLDRMLLKLMDALAVTRAKRKDLEGKEALTVGVDELLEGLDRRSRRVKPRRIRITEERIWVEVTAWDILEEIWEDWKRDVEELKAEGDEGNRES